MFAVSRHIWSERGSSAAAWMGGPEGGGGLVQGAENPSEIALRTPVFRAPPHTLQLETLWPATRESGASWLQVPALGLQTLEKCHVCRLMLCVDHGSEPVCPLAPSSFQGHHPFQQEREPQVLITFILCKPPVGARWLRIPFGPCPLLQLLIRIYISAGWKQEGVGLAQRPLQTPPF